MESNDSILAKVDFLIKKSISKDCSAEDIKTITSYSKLHSNNLILGKIFGYSVSDYAFAAMKWIGSKETLDLFEKLSAELPNERMTDINKLITSELYKEY